MLTSESGSVIFQFVLIIFLTMVNAFFASAEMAMVSMSASKINRLANDGDERAKLLQKLTGNPTGFLSTIQVGITLAGFFSSASAATGLSDDFGQYLAQWGLPYANTMALIIVTLLLSYFILVFGELYPKRLALTKPESIALFSVKPIVFVMKLASPFVKLLSLSTNLLLRLSGIDPTDLDEHVSREEIRALVELGQEQGALDPQEREMIEGVFQFDEVLAEQIMLPRMEVFLIDINQDVKDYVDDLLASKHSKIPAYSKDIDNIVGVLYIKDFFDAAYRQNFQDVDVRAILRQPFMVPDKMPIDDLFREMQRQRSEMAILIDEYGGFSGIVTLEDLIEEIMGELQDVYDPFDMGSIQPQLDGSYLIKGQTTLRDLNRQLGTDFDDRSKDYYTVAGMLIDLMGYVPEDQTGHEVETEEGLFEITGYENNRITEVRFLVKEVN